MVVKIVCSLQFGKNFMYFVVILFKILVKRSIMRWFLFPDLFKRKKLGNECFVSSETANVNFISQAHATKDSCENLKIK